MRVNGDSRGKNPGLRLLLRITLVAFAVILGWFNGLGRIDQLMYDRTISLFERPAPEDVLIITIDDHAINTLGRWPWPRSLHAKLLERLHDARAVGLDIVFSETDLQRIEDDRLLADAVRHHGRVVLPIVLDNIQRPTRADLPLAPLAQAAASLGYINVDPDDDGVLRRATWRSGDEKLPWRPFALAMLQAGGEAEQVDRFMAELASDTTTFIPYSGQPGHFQNVSYLSVLRGEIPPEAIKDKYVLVGAWATGLGDNFPSPVSHNVSGISGVEVIANLLHSARHQLIVRHAQTWQTVLASALPVFLLCLALPSLSPRRAIFYSLALLGTILLVAAFLLYVSGIWIPPTAALLGVAISYPIWSWRSQEAALRYMSREIDRLRIEYPPVLDDGALLQRSHAARSLDQQIDALDRMLAHVRNLRRFVADGLDGIADATLVIDKAGILKYRNRPAATYFMHLGIRPPRVGQAIAPALEYAFPDPATSEQVRQALVARGDDSAAQETKSSARAAADRISLEVRDRADHDLLFRCSPIRTARGARAGTVVTISDVSAIRQAERQREQTLQFISHDMRSPQNSILSLVALHRSEPQPSDYFLDRIAYFADRTLRLVDDFIQLTRAESMSISHDRLDLVSILYEIADDFWAASRPRNITLQVSASVPIALTCGDKSLIVRALSNLLDNAIKYSPDNSVIDLQLHRGWQTWDIDIQDAGPGIAPEEQAQLFDPFFRTRSAYDSDADGSGLGLTFVQTAAQRHGGKVTVYSEPGTGSRFTFSLPFAVMDESHIE